MKTAELIVYRAGAVRAQLGCWSSCYLGHG